MLRTRIASWLSFASTLGLTERELRVLRNSWAQVFRDEIFPRIDGELAFRLMSDVSFQYAMRAD